MLEPTGQNATSGPAKKSTNPAVGFGSSFAGGMAVFGLGGHWLDEKTGREPLFTLIGVGLGLFYGAWEVWKLVTMSNQKIHKNQQNKAESVELNKNDPSE